MTDVEKQFLELIKAGIWGQKAVVLIAPNSWPRIYDLAEKQSMLAVAFDGVQTLPKDNLPDMDILMDWLGQTEFLITQNEQSNKDVAHLIYCLNQNGIATRLMKGQGCAVYYPNPGHRQCGDIDLFVGKEYYQQAKTVIAKVGIAIKQETEKDVQFDFGNSPVEMHWLEAHLYSSCLNRVFQKICRKEEWRNPIFVIIGDEQIALFNPTFNVFYIFVHLYHHFLQVGVGLRQICDWMLVMHKEEANIDWQKLKSWIKAIKAERAWNVFYGLTVEYLGQQLNAAPEWMSSWDSSDVEFILADIMKVGNFGKYGDSMQKRSFRGGFSSNIASLIYLLKRLWRVQRFGRQEVWAYPVWKFKNDSGIWKRYSKK